MIFTFASFYNCILKTYLKEQFNNAASLELYSWLLLVYAFIIIIIIIIIIDLLS